jgi:hypothetical protein
VAAFDASFRYGCVVEFATVEALGVIKQETLMSALVLLLFKNQVDLESGRKRKRE